MTRSANTNLRSLYFRNIPGTVIEALGDGYSGVYRLGCGVSESPRLIFIKEKEQLSEFSEILHFQYCKIIKNILKKLQQITYICFHYNA